MIPDSAKVSDARVQSFQLRFNFITETDKLIIQANSQKDNVMYVGQIAAHPLIDFELIKQMLQEGEFKTLIKNEDLLKIRIGASIVELIPKQKSQIKQLKDTIIRLSQKQQQLENIIKTQKNEFDEYKKSFQDLRQTVQDMKMGSNTQKTIIQDMKKQLNEKLDTLKQEFKTEITKVRTQISEQQTKYSQSLLEFKKISEQSINLNKQSFDTTLQLKVVKDDINNFKEKMKKVEDTLKTQINNLKVIDQGQSQSINQLKKKIERVESETLGNYMIIDNHSKTLNEFSTMQKKVNQFESILEKRLREFQQKILNITQQNQKIKKENKLQQQKNSFKWSQKLKGEKLIVDGNTVSTNVNQSTQVFEFCLLDIGFTRDMKQKQSWKIKINKSSKYLMRIGICLRNMIRDKSYNGKDIKWGQTNNGVYLIDSGGWVYSHSQKNYTNKRNGFSFEQNDIINVEYDPINLVLRYLKNQNKERFQYPIILPPLNDAYHPCVCLYQDQNNIQQHQVKLISSNITL